MAIPVRYRRVNGSRLVECRSVERKREKKKKVLLHGRTKAPRGIVSEGQREGETHSTELRGVNSRATDSAVTFISQATRQIWEKGARKE